MMGGDDFNNALSVVQIADPYARYMPSKLFATNVQASGSRLDGAGFGYYQDPYTTGNQDSNRGVPIGSDNLSQSNSILTLKTRIPLNAAETSGINGRNVLDAAINIGTYLTFTPPCIIEFYESFTQGAPAGWHPTSWMGSVDPFGLGTGAPGWQEYDFPEALNGANYNAWGTVTGPGSSAFTFVNSSGYHLYSLVMTASNAKYYVDGVLIRTVNQDTTNSLKPYGAILTGVTFPGFNAGQWTSAGATGASILVDYYRIWIPNATANQIITPAQNLPTQQVAFNTNFSYVFPSATTTFGSAVSDFPQAIRYSDMEPGSATTGASGYALFPSELTWNSGTRTLSGSVTSRPGRLHLVDIAYVSGGSIGYTARGYIDVGPRLTSSSISYSNGTGSFDVYTICDVGTLLPKTVSVTGLPSGLTFNPSTFLITGTATPGSYTVSITVTNSSTQSFTNSSVSLTVGS